MNLTYGASVMIRKIDPDHIWMQTPFLIGALEPLLYDMMILGQRHYDGYR
jgi:hypothetical protein